jgi:hypothetical protein
MLTELHQLFLCNLAFDIGGLLFPLEYFEETGLAASISH